MKNILQNLTHRRMRLGGSNVIRHVTSGSSWTLSVGSQRLPLSVLGAAVFDTHIVTDSALTIGQRVTIVWGASDMESGIAIPGIVHWIGFGKHSNEAGIALHEPLPEDLTVKPQGGSRSNIRYECRVPGVLAWSSESEVSVAAIAMNYSRDGICFQVSVAPPVETPVKFAWDRSGQKNSLAGVVRWVIGQNGGFLTGCELITDHGYLISGVTV